MEGLAMEFSEFQKKVRRHVSTFYGAEWSTRCLSVLEPALAMLDKGWQLRKLSDSQSIRLRELLAWLTGKSYPLRLIAINDLPAVERANSEEVIAEKMAELGLDDVARSDRFFDSFIWIKGEEDEQSEEFSKETTLLTSLALLLQARMEEDLDRLGHCVCHEVHRQQTTLDNRIGDMVRGIVTAALFFARKQDGLGLEHCRTLISFLPHVLIVGKNEAKDEWVVITA